MALLQKLYLHTASRGVPIQHSATHYSRAHIQHSISLLRAPHCVHIQHSPSLIWAPHCVHIWHSPSLIRAPHCVHIQHSPSLIWAPHCVHIRHTVSLIRAPHCVHIRRTASLLNTPYCVHIWHTASLPKALKPTRPCYCLFDRWCRLRHSNQRVLTTASLTDGFVSGTQTDASLLLPF